MKRLKHPYLHKFDLETRCRIMVQHLEKQARLLQEKGYDPRPAVHWLNEILPLIRLIKYDEHHAPHENAPLPEDELQKHWEEFILMFLDDIKSGIRE